jgi:hypothetical protein
MNESCHFCFRILQSTNKLPAGRAGIGRNFIAPDGDGQPSSNILDTRTGRHVSGKPLASAYRNEINPSIRGGLLVALQN